MCSGFHCVFHRYVSRFLWKCHQNTSPHSKCLPKPPSMFFVCLFLLYRIFFPHWFNDIEIFRFFTNVKMPLTISWRGYLFTTLGRKFSFKIKRIRLFSPFLFHPAKKIHFPPEESGWEGGQAFLLMEPSFKSEGLLLQITH